MFKCMFFEYKSDLQWFASITGSTTQYYPCIIIVFSWSSSIVINWPLSLLIRLFQDYHSIQITYNFQNGIQNSQHPNPGTLLYIANIVSEHFLKLLYYLIHIAHFIVLPIKENPISLLVTLGPPSYRILRRGGGYSPS